MSREVLIKHINHALTMLSPNKLLMLMCFPEWFIIWFFRVRFICSPIKTLTFRPLPQGSTNSSYHSRAYDPPRSWRQQPLNSLPPSPLPSSLSHPCPSIPPLKWRSQKVWLGSLPSPLPSPSLPSF